MFERCDYGEGWRTLPRRRWARRYLHWIGRERLATLGYDLDSLLAEVASLPFSTRYLLSDCVRMPLGWLYSTFQLPVLKRSLTLPMLAL